MYHVGWLAANLARALHAETPSAPAPEPPFVIQDAAAEPSTSRRGSPWSASGLTGDGVRRLLDRLFKE